MSGFEAFLKQNKKNSNETIKFPASEDFVDENGKVIDWEIKPLKTKDADKIRKACSTQNKKGLLIVDNEKFNRMVAATCTVYPNLNDAELQDSYGVMGEEDLIEQLLDKDGEYQAYVKKCLEVSGYKKQMSELVDEAKN